MHDYLISVIFKHHHPADSLAYGIIIIVVLWSLYGSYCWIYLLLNSIDSFDYIELIIFNLYFAGFFIAIIAFLITFAILLSL